MMEKLNRRGKGENEKYQGEAVVNVNQRQKIPPNNKSELKVIS